MSFFSLGCVQEIEIAITQLAGAAPRRAMAHVHLTHEAQQRLPMTPSSNGNSRCRDSSVGDLSQLNVRRFMG